jgi:circadian clock protein KaiC
VRIYPRVLPPLASDRYPGGPLPPGLAPRISTGVPGLDALLGGGLPLGHTALVSGPTGTGKTIIGTLFLAEGVRQGEKGVAMFFEKGTSRLRNARLAQMAHDGHVRVVENRSLDLTVEELMEDLMNAIEETGATRVVIDSLSEFSLYLAPEVRAELRLAVFRMLTSLARRGVSALLTVGLEDRYTELRFSTDDVAFLTDAVVALRYAEIDGRLAKLISVVKVRGSAHSHELREYRITDAGIEVDGRPDRINGLLSGNMHRADTNH